MLEPSAVKLKLSILCAEFYLFFHQILTIKGEYLSIIGFHLKSEDNFPM